MSMTRADTQQKMSDYGSACGYRTARPYKTCSYCGLTMKDYKYYPSWLDEIEALFAIFDDKSLSCY